MTQSTETALLEQELIDTFSVSLKIDKKKIARDVLLPDLGVDSLDLVEAVFEFEEKYGIHIPFNANAQAMQGEGAMRTVGDLLDAVTSLILEKSNTVPIA